MQQYALPRLVAGTVALALALVAFALLPPPNASADTAEQSALEAYEHLPLSFAPNVGQTDDQVRYVAQGAAHAFLFTDEGAALSFAPSGDDTTGLALELRFAGASDAAQVDARREGDATVNQLTGESSDWETGVDTYEKLTYRDLWPGIDLVIRGEGQQLDYVFHVEPQANTGDIRLAYAGADSISVDDGNAVVHTEAGDLSHPRPVTGQDAGARFVVGDSGKVGIALGADNDRSRTVKVRTGLVYSSVVGGSAADSGRGVAVDDAGNAYVTGQTASADYPTTPGAHDRSIQNTDVFVTKFDSSGAAIVYSTFVGGFAFDSGNGIAVDDSGAAYIAGFTGSTNFPTTPGAFDPSHNGFTDAFVAKLNPSGSALEYSSYLGASGFASDGANGIAVDDAGSAYVTGFAGGNTFPSTPGAYDPTHNGRNDVYVTKFNPAGSALEYSTFVGGSLLDTGNAIAVDDDGVAYVTGFTQSTNFPTTVGALDSAHSGGVNDAFVTKVDPTGSTLAYSTYLGGTGDDNGRGIDVDDMGKAAHVTGSTGSSDYPTTDEAFDRSYNGGGDAFVTKLESSGTALVYSSYLGGAGNDSGLAIAVGEKGKAPHVTGSTSSDDYPTTRGAFDRSYNGGGDAFVTRLNQGGAVLSYSTFVGGTGADSGLAIAADEQEGTVYVAGSNGSGDAVLSKFGVRGRG